MFCCPSFAFTPTCHEKPNSTYLSEIEFSLSEEIHKNHVSFEITYSKDHSSAPYAIELKLYRNREEHPSTQDRVELSCKMNPGIFKQGKHPNYTEKYGVRFVSEIARLEDIFISLDSKEGVHYLSLKDFINIEEIKRKHSLQVERDVNNAH
jgi:hypothetical protein